MKRVTILLSAMIIAVSMSCGGDHGESPAAFDFEAPQAPTELTLTPGSCQMILEWDYPSELLAEISEFRIYYYYEGYGVEELVDETTSTSFTDTRLIGNMVYCYKVSAVDLEGREGWRSETECGMVNP